MNTLSGSSQFSNVSAFDTKLSCTNIVSDEYRTMAVGSVPVSCGLLTKSLPTKAAPCMSVNGVQPANVFTGYPVLTLPSAGGSPRHRSRSPRSGLPRTLHSPVSPHRSRLLANKTALEGQPCIDKVFQPIVPNRAASEPRSPSLSVCGTSLSSEIQSYSMSPDRKRARPSVVSVSPLLSRNHEHFVDTRDFHSSDISTVGSNRLDNNCNRTDMQKEKYSLDMVTPVETRQSVSADVVLETGSVENTQVVTAEAQLESFEVASVVSSAGSSNSTVSVSENYTHKKTELSPLKMSIPKLQKMRQIWEKNHSPASNTSTKTCSVIDVASEGSVSLSSSIVSTEVNSVVTSNEAQSVYVCATSTAASSSFTIVVSSQKNSSAADSKVSDATAHLDMIHVGQQTVHGRSVERDSFKSELVPAVKISDISRETYLSATDDSKVSNTATSKCAESSSTDQHITPDHCVKHNKADSTEATSVSAAKADAASEVRTYSLTGSKDNQVDLDKYTFDDSDEFSYAPIESKLVFLLLFQS